MAGAANEIDDDFGSGKPTGRRKWIAIAIAAAVAVLAIGGTTWAVVANRSTGGQGAGAANAAGQDKFGGTIVFATDREPASLDPVFNQDVPQSLIARQYLDSLVRQKADGSFEPWLAESWETSPDQTVYTFKLRKDVTFSDGTPLNAKAIETNINWWLNPENKNTLFSSPFEHYKGSKIIDDHTIAIDLGAPYADFLSIVSEANAGIQSPAGLARGQKGNTTAPIGSGPFVVQSWDKQSQVVLVRRDDYSWAPQSAQHQGRAYADRIVWRFITEPTTRFGALQTGEVNVIDGVPPESFVQAKSDANVSIINGSTPGVPYQLDLNTRRAPFNDVNVRKAFLYVADVKSGLDTVYFGARTPVDGVLSPSTVFADKKFDGVYHYDRDAAVKLLEQAGWTQIDSEGYRVKDGRRLVVHVNLDFEPQPQEYALLDYVAGKVKDAGFQLSYEKSSFDVTTQRRQDWDYDLTTDYWTSPNTAGSLTPVYRSDQIDGSSGYHNNGIGYVDPKLDKALQDGGNVSDPKERQIAYTKAQQIISDQALVLPLFSIPLQYASRADKVQGVSTDPSTNQVSFYDTWVAK